MKLSPNTNPPEPDNLLIRFHSQTGAAIDVLGTTGYQDSHWLCHGCGDRSGQHSIPFSRQEANKHAATCLASHHRLY
ncbi:MULTISPECIES: hypothetical protein [unclassified Streptomyces]|uniref:hypothetical protein n=1 Tax=unclassified Streptomyces TaxID=2593676 RepID=UPI0036A2B25C